MRIGEYPCGQVGTINPTDMPDGGGQQLRMATIVLRPSRLITRTIAYRFEGRPQIL